eukprot:TRINITY_DN5248_c0_g1_i4.p1 TRINITY_DN5248_c0_g1~~TRINITY_DN5248_c0_g1_i4.p1  ORF type:complete len:277 (-),score=77.23 TRINITY_DN5248_c0_g1_i4:39-869(-)
MKLLLQEKEDIENHLRELGANGQFEQEDGNLKRVPTRNLKKIPRVRPEDVHQFGVLMNLRLRASRIPYDEVEKSVFKEGIVKKGCISIKEFEEILKGDPFRIREEGIALLIARYFIEDASDDFVILERDRTLELSIVRSIMKNFIGPYHILTPKEDKRVRKAVTRLVSKYRANLRQVLNNKPTAKQGFVSAKDIRDGFKELDLNIKPEEYDYLVLKLFEVSDDEKKLDHQLLFKTFVDEKEIRRLEALAQAAEEHQNGEDHHHAYAEEKFESDDDD